jgi:hypothetical protein
VVRGSAEVPLTAATLAPLSANAFVIAHPFSPFTLHLFFSLFSFLVPSFSTRIEYKFSKLSNA